MARAMKDSGIEWIGEIPENWCISRLKYIGKYVNGFAFKPEQWGDTGRLIIRIQDLTGSNDNPNYYAGDIDEKYHVRNGDILVSWAATLAAFRWNRGDGLLNQHIFKAINNEKKVDNAFFFWLIKVAMEFMNNENKHGIMMQHVTLDVFGNFGVALPPIEEQRRIAVFMDTECSKIDAVIEQTRVSIEEYKNLKQTIITRAVTKGIRPNRPMKDSGVDWIGDIPADWRICKLRHIGATQNGISKGGEFFGEGSPFVSYGDVYRNISLPRTVKGLIKSTEEEQKLYSVERGDIFFTRTSETIEEVGFSSVCEHTIPYATFAGFLIRVRPYDETLDIGYSKYYFRSNHHRFYLVKQMNLVTRASLGQPLLKGMTVLVPSKSEQREIAAFLDKKCREIDTIISSKEKLIQELEAYKKSMIFEYVTGKKQVES